MFTVKRLEEYEINWCGRIIEHTEEYQKNFLDHDFLAIVNYISKKGLDIHAPAMLNGWDTSFVYRKLSEPGHGLGASAEELATFLYMRLHKTCPVWIERKGLFELKIG